MLIPKEDRKKIHAALFNEGVLVATKNYNQPKHDTIDTKNLYVIKALQSLTSKGYVKTQFSWQYYYYTLTDEGVEYLRNWLHIPDAVIPVTHKSPATNAPSSAPSFGRRNGGGYGREDSYRRRDNDSKEPIPGSGPSFRS